nr:hypothetical protein [Patescibacteria group bacterium]
MFSQRVRDAVIQVSLSLLSLFVAGACAELFFRLTAPKETYGYSTGLFQADTVLGYALTPQKRGELVKPEFRREIVVNGQGLREDVDIRIPKPLEEYRVLVLGDSFTMGGTQDASSTFVALSERYLQESGKQVEVINAGVAGYNTVQE